MGMLPVGDKDRLIGFITDHEIALRAVANGKGPHTPVRAVMGSEVMYCTRDKEPVGVLSLADVATLHSGDRQGAP